MKNIGINVNTTKDDKREVLDFIIKTIYNECKDINVSVYNDCIGLNTEKSHELDMIIVLGGDGTILNTARQVAKYNVPIFGINIGHLGFLAQVESSDIESAIKSILEGEYTIEERLMLKCSYRQDGMIKTSIGLNDVVLSKGVIARIVKYKIHIDGRYYNTFAADGIIMSTPTGSTAYSLSAGGPIIYPTLNNFILTPMYSQTLGTRTIVLDGKSNISINFSKNDEDIFLSIDGQEFIKLDKTETIDICAAENKCKLVKLNSNDYFDTLRKKVTFRAKEYYGEQYEDNETC
ncbi:NAD(+)/NADH kinase [Clostridium sp. P21]|uniref:NAD kinase n=1 Tax=Clostridium muellerianum TaxID=2716538 RepID=A0A7Y0HM80_9CLOT|nr:NAD(+)/NADH kinase [Clostridium muellerianum]NMM61367.1 NAD(+)/NADH kinase [Clostridium muellerianum]